MHIRQLCAGWIFGTVIDGISDMNLLRSYMACKSLASEADQRRRVVSGSERRARLVEIIHALFNDNQVR